MAITLTIRLPRAPGDKYVVGGRRRGTGTIRGDLLSEGPRMVPVQLGVAGRDPLLTRGDCNSSCWEQDYAFLAELLDGSFRAWGRRDSGVDISSVKSDLAKGVKQVWSTRYAFLAELLDGSFRAWGQKDWGGDISLVTSRRWSPTLPRA
jgi:hypothetical protein